MKVNITTLDFHRFLRYLQCTANLTFGIEPWKQQQLVKTGHPKRTLCFCLCLVFLVSYGFEIVFFYYDVYRNPLITHMQKY